MIDAARRHQPPASAWLPYRPAAHFEDGPIIAAPLPGQVGDRTAEIPSPRRKVSPMLLVVDVGNSRVKLGLATEDESDFVRVWRVATARDRTPDEWLGLLNTLFSSSSVELAAVSGVAIASVVPAVTRWLATACRERLGIEPLVLVSDPFVGLSVATDQPAETGIDRVVNAFAAYTRRGGPTVVVDAGTATKIDAVTADGRFLGGAIAPGIGLTLDALAGRAVRLYAVELLPPATAIGRNTVAALQSGVVLGYLELCAGMIRRVKAELGGEPHVFVTGGDGHIIAENLPEIDEYDPRLTLEGIALAYRRAIGAG
jgi:type III pantothenate kinase